MKKILLVGSGAREHAIAYSLKKNNDVELYSCQSYSNYGITELSKAVLQTETDHKKIVEFCNQKNIDFCVIGPESPLEAGLTDALSQANFKCASPSKAAARIETDKHFMRSILDKHNVPGQIKNLTTSSVEAALEFCEEMKWKVAIKPIGLTAGKGVKVWGDHLSNEEEVQAYIREILTEKISGHHAVLIEDLLIGQEFTIHFFCDGKSAFPTPPVQDHKRAFDHDAGPNTGGMGSYSFQKRLPFLNEEDYEFCCRIGQQIIEALNEEGSPFKGILYGQFILTSQGPKIIEFNSRFGDPEAINTLLLLDSDFSEICSAIITGELTKSMIRFKNQFSLASYAVPAGYGIASRENEILTIDEEIIKQLGTNIFFGSCNFVDKIGSKITVKTTKSRTFAVAAVGDDLKHAYHNVINSLKSVEGLFHYRTDIGSEESIKNKMTMMSSLIL